MPTWLTPDRLVSIFALLISAWALYISHRVYRLQAASQQRKQPSVEITIAPSSLDGWTLLNVRVSNLEEVALVVNGIEVRADVARLLPRSISVSADPYGALSLDPSKWRPFDTVERVPLDLRVAPKGTLPSPVSYGSIVEIDQHAVYGTPMPQHVRVLWSWADGQPS